MTTTTTTSTLRGSLGCDDRPLPCGYRGCTDAAGHPGLHSAADDQGDAFRFGPDGCESMFDFGPPLEPDDDWQPIKRGCPPECPSCLRRAAELSDTLDRSRERLRDTARARIGEIKQRMLARRDLGKSAGRGGVEALIGGLMVAAWPRSGSMRSGRCYPREPLGPLTAENASGSWATPTAGMTKHIGMEPSAMQREAARSLRTVNAYSSLAVQVAAIGDWNGRLNPSWVEWLMGWPLGWTGFAPLGTAGFRAWRRQHSPSCKPEL